MDRYYNLFSFATKELSQDAFIGWLVSNYNNTGYDDVKKTSLIFLSRLSSWDISEIEKATIDVHLQKYKMDVAIELKLPDKSHLIVIEDKVKSKQSDNQLLDYYKENSHYFNQFSQQSFYYYKTNLVTKEEKSMIPEPWKVLDVNGVYKLFDYDIKVDHAILKDYLDNLKKIYDVFTCDYPLSTKEFNDYHWLRFAEEFATVLDEKIEYGHNNFRGNYRYIVVNIKDGWNIHPYLEFRSNDLSSGIFRARILTYGLEERIQEAKLDTWHKQISSSELFKIQHKKRQIAVYKSHKIVTKIEDLREEMLQVIEEYRSIFIKS